MDLIAVCSLKAVPEAVALVGCNSRFSFPRHILREWPSLIQTDCRATKKHASLNLRRDTYTLISAHARDQYMWSEGTWQRVVGYLPVVGLAFLSAVSLLERSMPRQERKRGEGCIRLSDLANAMLFSNVILVLSRALLLSV